jgi:Family of unknown function (DUF6622)
MIGEILRRTPPWVWVLLIGLIYLGLVQSRTRTVSKTRLLMLPTFMLALSLYGVYSAFGTWPIAYAAWAVGVLLSVVSNQLIRRPSGVSYSGKSRQFTVPGSWLPFLLIMAIFGVKYVAAVEQALHPSLQDTVEFVLSLSLGYGLISGVFLARSVRILESSTG